jgi:hypothetical protein
VGWLIAVVGMMVALTGGWLLVSRAVSGTQPSMAGTVLTIGPGGTDSAQFAPGAGWAIRTAHSDPEQGWSLDRGLVRVSVTYVSLLSPAQAGRLWPGLRSILRLSGSSVRLGQPVPVTSAPGLAGRADLTGPVAGPGLSGQAVIVPVPDRRFAIEVISVAPPGDAADARATAGQITRELRFPEVAA